MENPVSDVIFPVFSFFFVQTMVHHDGVKASKIFNKIVQKGRITHNITTRQSKGAYQEDNEIVFGWCFFPCISCPHFLRLIFLQRGNNKCKKKLQQTLNQEIVGNVNVIYENH